MLYQQLPSLEEIYDFSSQDLKKIVQNITQNILHNKLSAEEQIRFQEYIENVNTELEERKTLQFFQQLCALDNPYLKKVTDFNNQFLKLASQAIAAQQEITDLPKTSTDNLLNHIKQLEIDKQTENQANDAISIASTKTRQTQMTNNFADNDADKNYTATSQKKSADYYEKKLRIGTKTTKNNKNTIKDFILSTLSKNKAQGCYVVKKAGNAPQKSQPTYTVNERGHIVNPHTLQPISTKIIKSSSTVKQKTAQPVTSSHRNIKQSTNRINQKQLDRKKQQAIEKVKGIKSQKKKEKLNNKDLVEMIRQQEKSKQNKKLMQIQINNRKADDISKEQSFNYKKQKQLQDIKKESTQTEKLEQNQGEYNIQVQQFKQSAQKSTKKHQIKSKTEQNILQQTNSTNSDQKLLFNTNLTLQKKQQQVCFNDHQQKQINVQSQAQRYVQEPNTSKISYSSKQIQNKQMNYKNAQSKDQSKQSYMKQLQQIALMKEQLESQKNAIHAIQTQKQIIKPKQQQFGVITDISINSDQKDNTNTDKTSVPLKKCYNEQYWIHIREQAEHQIQRFKQQKQLQEASRIKLKNNLQKSLSQQSNLPQQLQKQEQLNQTNNPYQQKEELKNQEDQFVEKRRKQLKLMINDHNKRIPPKRPPMPIYAPPKPLYALPTFNYLQIYPTFNHIFSVMYTKAQHQALIDIPMIMRDLTNMFTTHLQHFKQKSGGYFQPAIFLPFDSSNNFNLTDPRQLLLHAQNTYVNLKKIVQRTQIFNGNLHGQFNTVDNRYYRVVKTKQEVYDIISTGFLRRKGWKQLPHGCSLRSSWNLFWSWSKPDVDVSKLLVWQKINHFPFNKNLSRKDLLYKNLDSFRKMMKIQFNFLPLTFNLPKQFTQFCIKFHQEEISNRDRNYWIMKPIGKSRGRGISVINNLAELNYTDNIVVQKYIANPLLLDGYKFDMRIYVLVTNFHPLQAFLYKQGFARLSTQKFSLEPMYIKNTFMHLTNFAINRNNQEAKQTANFSGGSKISLKVLKDKITKMNYSFNNIWSQVTQIIIKSLLGCSISVPAFPTAFQLFGYDIMIDTDSNCHLIQINASPSLQRSYLIDQIVKQSLIDDILDIVDPADFDKEQLLDIMSERLAGKKKITPEQDLIAIARVLKYKKLRKFGQVPENMGLFEMIAPSSLSTELQRLIKARSGANNPKNID